MCEKRSKTEEILNDVSSVLLPLGSTKPRSLFEIVDMENVTPYLEFF